MKRANTSLGYSERTGWILMALLALTAALLGGSSRMDAVQLAALRPLSALFLVPALYGTRRALLNGQRFLLVLFVAFIGWVLLQLVPLPPSMWQALPGREAVVAMDALLGLHDLWRPISFSPVRGWNALASLVLPLAALLLALAARADSRTLLILIAGIGVLDASLGLVQVIDGPRSILYFYPYVNRGSPVGVFANENHSAVFSAIILLVIARLAIDGYRTGERSAIRIFYPAAFLLVSLAALVTGSRAGFIAAALALGISALMVWSAFSRRHVSRPTKSRSLAVNSKVHGAVAILMLLAIPVALIAFERMPAITEILARDAFEDLRWEIWPSLQDLASTYWTTGSGFGSFELVYKIVEPDHLLMPKYVNQAHNDWAQLIIEGGIPAVAMLFALLVWVARSIWEAGQRRENGLANMLFWLALFTIIAFASVIDYPLRVPVFQLCAIWLLVALAMDRREGRTQGALD